jgi:1,4-alpha-glucan branching enzyme
MSATRPGELAIVLHTHMPYVEGFGTWPFGEEWLWEAIATSYLPLLRVLGVPGEVPFTLSLTPVLCDQLESPGAIERCLRFLREVRPQSHQLDLQALHERGDAGPLQPAPRRAEIPGLIDALERSAAEYAAAADELARLGHGLLAALGAHADWTSSATHAVLPLVALDAGLRLQLDTGVAAHRRRFGEWRGGFWLPECAHAPWLHEPLEQAGVRATCVELTARFGRGDSRHLRALRTLEGPILWPIDRALIDLAWGGGGYPSRPAYRSRDRLTEHRHRIWANDGAPYDSERAARQVRADAREFVARARERLSAGGIAVCAFDTELFGHWWHEGIDWLVAVVEEADRQGLRLTGLDDALERTDPVPAPDDLGVSSWGEGGDLRTWSAPAVASFAWRMRTAELSALRPGASPSARALRELLALQASDWAFLAYRDWSGDYPEQRAAAHHRELERALAGEPGQAPEVRNLAPVLAA